MAVPAANLHRVPDDLDLTLAAIAEPLSVATRTVIDNSRITADSTVLVQGPGPIGLLSAQVANICGSQVVISGVDSDESYRLPLARKMGFETVNVQSGSLADRIDDTFGARSLDVVVDATGHRSGVETGIKVVKKGGQIVIVGLPDETSEVFFTDAVRAELDIQCSYASKWSNFDQALSLLRQGAIDTDRFIDRRFERSDPVTALDAFVEGKTVKPIFDFSP